MTTIDVILVALRDGPKTREALHAAGSRKWTADELTAALGQLAAKGIVRSERLQAPRGRPAEIWRLTSPNGSPGSHSISVENGGAALTQRELAARWFRAQRIKLGLEVRA